MNGTTSTSTGRTSRIDANRPKAERVTDADTYTVTLDLTPIAAGLLNDIALALRGNGHLMTLLANNRVGTPEHASVRDSILARLAHTSALHVQLGPDQAMDLSGDLFDAAGEPDRCEGGACGGEFYTTRADRLCERDGHAADLAEAGYTVLRAV